MQRLREAVAEGIIGSADGPIPETSYQPASLDLRLGPVAYRLRCSFLPDRHDVRDKLMDYSMGEIDLTEGGILERNRPYLIPLEEGLDLPMDIQARANPKSSTGRLDIFTRVITDRSHRFDEIRPGYRGRLFLELVSRTFTVQVRSGLTLNQLRLVAGRPRASDVELLAEHRRRPLLYDQGAPVPPEEVAFADGLFLSVGLKQPEGKPVGYRAKKNSRLLDLSRVGVYDPEDFWEPIYAEPKDRVVLEPEEFYLLLSAEKVSIPAEFAAEMTAYDPTSGELRTHYAGFFDPGFGFDRQGLVMGTRAVMEIRAHDVPFMVEDRQKVSKLSFERMLEPPDSLYGAALGSSYQHQDLTLSKHFRRPRPLDPGQRSFF